MSPVSMHFVRGDGSGLVRATVVTRRVYRLPAFDGALLGGVPAPLVAADPDDPRCAGGDLMAVARPGTDLVVHAHAHSVDGPVASMEVSVQVHAVGGALAPKLSKRLRVTGDRAVVVDPATGEVGFTPPTPFVEMPLTWERAYGGRDKAALARHVPDEVDEIVGTDDLFRYPRNDLGCGYAVSSDAAALAGLRLPNVEDPDDLLTPARLVLRHADEWPAAPVAASFEAVPAQWWPRAAWLGMGSGANAPAEAYAEVRAGLVPAELAAPLALDGLRDRRDRRWFQAAAPGLWGDTWAGDETIVLTGLHPHRRRVTVTLPAERPRVTVRLGDAELAAEPALRAVEVDVEAGTVSLVWTAAVTLPATLGRRDLDAITHHIEWPQP